MKRALTSTLSLGLLLLAACGTTIGDPCTTNEQCGGQICINQSYTPGGYCSRQCTLADPRTCPSGSVCIRDGQARDNPACFHVCRAQPDCRTGYVCKAVKDSLDAVCVGPTGL